MNTSFRHSGSHGAMNGRTLAFMIEAQRRVIAHCRKLLATDGLSAGDHNRLVQLLNEAKSELQQLTLAEAA